MAWQPATPYVWTGPGPAAAWQARSALTFSLELTAADTEAWATLDGAPCVAARRIGRGAVATVGFHPSEARDEDGAATALLRHLLVAAAAEPVAWHDFSGTLLLRMDDPGGAQNVHWKEWCYPKLGQHAWAEIADDLRMRTRGCPSHTRPGGSMTATARAAG